jgi:hypothetical protein
MPKDTSTPYLSHIRTTPLIIPPHPSLRPPRVSRRVDGSKPPRRWTSVKRHEGLMDASRAEVARARREGLKMEERMERARKENKERREERKASCRCLPIFPSRLNWLERSLFCHVGWEGLAQRPVGKIGQILHCSIPFAIDSSGMHLLHLKAKLH